MDNAVVLIVEDDGLIRASLCRALEAFGLRALPAASIAEARDVLAVERPSLVLLDLGLPDGDGLELCAEIAALAPTLPVIVLTARSAEADIVVALRAGAIDYIVKPFKLAELHARIQSQLRLRAFHAREEAEKGPRDELRIGRMTIRVAAHQVLLDDAIVAFRPREFALLVRLVEGDGDVVTRERLIEDVWDAHWWGPTKTLDVHINAIRRKLQVPHGEQGPIVTVRGVGYRFDGAELSQ